MDIHSISNLAAQYSRAGLDKTWAGTFLLSLAASKEIPRGRGIDKLEEIIKKGDPQTWPDWGLRAQCVEFMKKISEARNEDIGILKNIVEYVDCGRKLSDRQIFLVNKIINSTNEAPEMKDLSNDDKIFIEVVRRRVKGSSSHYWNHRAGVFSSLKKAFQSVGIANPLFYSEDIPSISVDKIDKKHWDVFTSSYSAAYEAWCTVPDLYGKICKIKTQNDELCIVLSDRSVNQEGKILVNVLHGGIPKFVRLMDIKEVKQKQPKKQSTKKAAKV